MKTVKVRIPFAVNQYGTWHSQRCYSGADKDNLQEAQGYLLRDESIVWITAEVPIPEPVEVEGRVSE